MDTLYLTKEQINQLMKGEMIYATYDSPGEYGYVFQHSLKIIPFKSQTEGNKTIYYDTGYVHEENR